MDSLEVNKGVAAILVAGIAFMVFGIVSKTLVHPKQLHESAIRVEVAAAPAAGGAKETPLTPIGPLLASADAAAGEALTKKQCAACHTFVDGGKHGVGPNLYAVLGRDRKSVV